MHRPRRAAPAAISLALFSAVVAAAVAAKSHLGPPAAASAPAARVAGPELPPKPIVWSHSLAAAQKQAAAEKRLVLLDLYTDWCGYCKKLDAEVYPTPQVEQIVNRAFVPVRLNAETQEEGAAATGRFAVTGFPAIIILDGSTGKELYRIGGYAPADEFSKALNAMASAYEAMPGLQARLAANPSDVDAAAGLLDIYVGQSRAKDAEGALAHIAAADPQNRSGKLSAGALEIGRLHMDGENAEDAAPEFRRALQTSHVPGEIAFAHLNLALCAAAQQNAASARRELNAAIGTSGAPDTLRKAAREILAKLPPASQAGRTGV